MKRIYTLLFAVLVTSSVFAQEGGSDQKSVRFGIVVNPGLSSDYVGFATGISQSNYNGKVIYNSSVDTINLYYAKTVSGVLQNPDTSQIKSRRYHFNSIDLPFKLKFKTPEIGYFTYFAELGVVANINYKVSARDNSLIIGGSSVVLNDDLEQIDVNDDTNWYRIGSTVNAGFEYNFVGSTSLLVSVNWGNSFTNALRSESRDLSYKASGLAFKQSAKLDYIGLTVGVLF